jgi:hypothetical protein
VLNKALPTTFALCSVIVYVGTLLIIFDAPWLTEPTGNLLLLNYSHEHRVGYFVILVIFLTFPDFIAIISYSKNRAKISEMNRQFSAFWRFIIDSLIITVVLFFLYEFLLNDAYYYRQYYLSKIQISIIVLLGLSFISFCIFQPFSFLTNIVSMQDAHAYLRELINKPPYINFHVHAYHYETRIRVVTEDDTDATTRTETYQEQVTTLSLSQPYKIASWRDVTNLQELLSPQRFRIVKIKIKTLINPVDSKTQQHYDAEWKDFCHQYRGADVHVNFSVNSGLTAMKTDILLAFLDIKEKPFFLNIFFYFCASLSPFGWAYSLWLDQISAVSEKTILKEYSQFERLKPSHSFS